MKSSNMKIQKEFIYSEMKRNLLHSIGYEKDVAIRDVLVFAAKSLDRFCMSQWCHPTVEDFHKELMIKVILNETAETLTIVDNGQGLQKSEICTFMNSVVKVAGERVGFAVKKGLQFASGPYSIGLLGLYFIAYKVEVVTKHENDEEYKWESAAFGEFTLEKTGNPKPSRGTKVILFLRKEYICYLHNKKLKEIVKTYCENILYPIKTAIMKTTINDGLRQSYLLKDVQINEFSELWNRSPSSIEYGEYERLYKFLFTDFDEFWYVFHINNTKTVSFKALIFIPYVPPNIFDPNSNEMNLKFYSNGVFIKNNGGSMLPKHLSFLRGVIDCPNFPKSAESLIVSKSKVVNEISEIISKKVIQYILELKSQSDNYIKFYEAYSTVIKYMILDNYFERENLKTLLMYKTTKSKGKLTFVKNIMDRMANTPQQYLYYICGERVRKCLNSPFIEYLKANDFEVILMTDPIDSYFISVIEHYSEVLFWPCNQTELPIPMQIKEKCRYLLDLIKYNQLCKRILKAIGRNFVRDVVVSKRLEHSPFCVVEDRKNSAFLKGIKESHCFTALPLLKRDPRKKYVLEINPKNSFIIALNNLRQDDFKKLSFEVMAHLLFGSATIFSGFRNPHSSLLYPAVIFKCIEINLISKSKTSRKRTARKTIKSFHEDRARQLESALGRNFLTQNRS